MFGLPPESWPLDPVELARRLPALCGPGAPVASVDGEGFEGGSCEVTWSDERLAAWVDAPSTDDWTAWFGGWLGRLGFDTTELGEPGVLTRAGISEVVYPRMIGDAFVLGDFAAVIVTGTRLFIVVEWRRLAPDFHLIGVGAADPPAGDVYADETPPRTELHLGRAGADGAVHVGARVEAVYRIEAVTAEGAPSWDHRHLVGTWSVGGRPVATSSVSVDEIRLVPAELLPPHRSLLDPAR